MTPLDGDQLLDLFVRGALGRAGRKRARRATRFLGGSGGGGFLTASTVMAAVGVAWGIFDSMRQQTAGPGAAGAAIGDGPAPSLPPSTPPSVAPGVPPPNVARVVRLAASAANADGALSDAERMAIVDRARAAGIELPTEEILAGRHPLREIVAGVTSEAERRDLYVLAFAIVRADEGVSGAERIYLAQLAHALGLDAAAATALERETAAAIDTDGATPAPA